MPKLNRKMVITFSGIFYHAQSPLSFLKALKKVIERRPALRDQLEARFVGNLSEADRKTIKQLGLTDNISYEGYLNHEDAVRHLIGSYILWMIVGHQKGSELISTGKLFEYFGTRKPILGLVPDGAAKEALMKYGASKIADPDDINQISSTLDAFIDEWTNGTLPTADEEFVVKHSRDVLARDLAKIFSSTLVNDYVYL